MKDNKLEVGNLTDSQLSRIIGILEEEKDA
jgi:hypothetical protein